MEFRFTWHNTPIGAAVWAPFGSHGWRAAIVDSLGRKYAYLVFDGGGRGKREYAALRRRLPALRGKDKPIEKPIYDFITVPMYALVK